MTTRFPISGLLLVLLIAACVEGREPPEPTALVEVPGMPFLLGTSRPCSAAAGAAGWLPTWPVALVDLGPFYIEEHEVTNRQYEYCVAVGECAAPLSRKVPGIAGDYYGTEGYRGHPVVNVTADMAGRYCGFLGRRLPTEVEWERVAAGPGTNESEKRAFPFRNGAGGTIPSCAGRKVRTPWCDGGTTPAPAGGSTDDFVVEGSASSPATPEVRTVRDLAGNVAEWVTAPVDADPVCTAVLGERCECVACGDATACLPDRFIPCGACDADDPEGYPKCAGSGQIRIDAALLAGTPDGIAGRALARGGSYVDPTETACRASTTDRGRAAGPAEVATLAGIGFRCAVPQSCVNGRDDDGDGRTDRDDPKCRDGTIQGERP